MTVEHVKHTIKEVNPRAVMTPEEEAAHQTEVADRIGRFAKWWEVQQSGLPAPASFPRSRVAYTFTGDVEGHEVEFDLQPNPSGHRNPDFRSTSLSITPRSSQGLPFFETRYTMNYIKERSTGNHPPDQPMGVTVEEHGDKTQVRSQPPYKYPAAIDIHKPLSSVDRVLDALEGAKFKGMSVTFIGTVSEAPMKPPKMGPH